MPSTIHNIARPVTAQSSVYRLVPSMGHYRTTCTTVHKVLWFHNDQCLNKWTLSRICERRDPLIQYRDLSYLQQHTGLAPTLASQHPSHLMTTLMALHSHTKCHAQSPKVRCIREILSKIDDRDVNCRITPSKFRKLSIRLCLST